MNILDLIIYSNLAIINIDEVDNRQENRPLKSAISSILGDLRKNDINVAAISSAKEKADAMQKVTELGWSPFLSENDIFCQESIESYRKAGDIIEFIINKYDTAPEYVAILDIFPHGLDDATVMGMNYYSFANSAPDREKIENFAKAKDTPIEVIDLY